jgi:SAM-dependent methyltransferase
MNLLDIIRREAEPRPWVEGEKIPWDEPEFSRRMLAEHLSQRHDAASRRASVIKKHVDWIHREILSGQPGRILDLGCGPGLYATYLAQLGHVCHGIDFSPASIEYAVEHAPEGCTFTIGDLRTTDFGDGYDLVMFIFGELNVFKPQDARLILQKAYEALKPGGSLLLEVSTFDGIEQGGNQPAMWYSSQGGLFSDEPHLCLMESFWDEDQAVATERYWVVEAGSGSVRRYASSSQAYEDDEYQSMLMDCGFEQVHFFESLTGDDDVPADELAVIWACK